MKLWLDSLLSKCHLQQLCSPRTGSSADHASGRYVLYTTIDYSHLCIQSIFAWQKWRRQNIKQNWSWTRSGILQTWFFFSQKHAYTVGRCRRALEQSLQVEDGSIRFGKAENCSSLGARNFSTWMFQKENQAFCQLMIDIPSVRLCIFAMTVCQSLARPSWWSSVIVRLRWSPR